MLRRQQFSACLAALTALLFVLFFDVSKHQPALAVVNPFTTDPYDAVGSFATQLALVAALLALVRAFRPYGPAPAPTAQAHLLARAAALTSLAVLVTMASNGVALARHPALWMSQPAGRALAGLVAGLAVVALLTLWSALAVRGPCPPRIRRGALIDGLVAFALCLGAFLLLAFYPEDWTRQVVTEVVTIAAGVLALFLPLWALDRVLFATPPAVFADVLNDVGAIADAVCARLGIANLLGAPVRFLARMPIVRWLNPRRHPWAPMLLLALLLGALLWLAEMLGEGGGQVRLGLALLVAAIFLGGECFAVIVGYVLLARPLGLFRCEAPVRGRYTAPIPVR